MKNVEDAIKISIVCIMRCARQFRKLYHITEVCKVFGTRELIEAPIFFNVQLAYIQLKLPFLIFHPYSFYANTNWLRHWCVSTIDPSYIYASFLVYSHLYVHLISSRTHFHQNPPRQHQHSCVSIHENISNITFLPISTYYW